MNGFPSHTALPPYRVLNQHASTLKAMGTMPRSFRIVTLGCKVNQYESAHLTNAFTSLGWHQALEGEPADVTVVNTCAVTQKATHQSRQEVRKAIRNNPNGAVAAVGCYAQVFPKELSEIEGVDIIVGNTEKARLPELVLNLEHSKQRRVIVGELKAGVPFEFLPVEGFANRRRAYLKIQDGCESFCSYCIVPYARGGYRSLEPAKVLTALEQLAVKGYKEVVLTGIHLGKYGCDLGAGMDLKHLLHLVGRQALPLRIRLSSMEPNEIDQSLVEMVASEEWLCRHFHVPLQSGHDGVLLRMKRPYNARQFAQIIQAIHEAVPLAAIGVDVMAGFPGEDECAHRNSFALIKDLPISYLHVFPFSQRPGTPAAILDGQNSSKVIKERASALRELGGEKRVTFYQRCLGRRFEILAERWHPENNKVKLMEGISDNYLPIRFASSTDSRGKLVSVLLEELLDGKLFGRMSVKDRRPSDRDHD